MENGRFSIRVSEKFAFFVNHDFRSSGCGILINFPFFAAEGLTFPMKFVIINAKEQICISTIDKIRIL